MPPIDPPITAYHRSMPSASASATSSATWSRMVVTGKRDPNARPSGASDDGPVVPWQPPSTLGHTTKKRSVSMAHPGPMVPSHQPTSPCPGPTGPAAWLSRLSAWSTRTAFDASGASSPHVSYATVTSSSRPPASSFRPSANDTNCRRPGSSPGRHAPVTGNGSTTTTALRTSRPVRCSARYPPRGRSRLCGAEPGVEVGEDVVDRLDAHRQPDKVGCDPRGGLLVGDELLVGGGGRVDRKAPHVTYVGEVAVQLQGVDELLARLQPAVDAERDDGALAAGQVLLRLGVP